MGLKLLDSLITICNRNYLLKSQLSRRLMGKAPFSTNDQNDPPDPLKKIPIKDLLNSSSPLRSMGQADVNDPWSTSPYPAGTVFRNMETEETPKEDLAQANNYIIVFPGQGNQFVGMATNLLKYSVALEMFNTAKEILNYDLLQVCQEGPEEKLNDTKYCQPATFVCSLALLEKIKHEMPWVISKCVATCGYSLGELTALVFSGCVSFEQGLTLVKARAKAMALCCEKAPGGMLTIFTGPRTTLGKAFSDAIDHCKSKGIENPQCATASYLFPNCKVIAGNIEALDFITENAQKYGIRRHSKLPVSGAFHTNLMKDAGEDFVKTLNVVKFKTPKIDVYSNVTGLPYKNENMIKKFLPKQIYSPVKWEQTVQNVLSLPKGVSLPFIYECGPGSSLISTVKKINHQMSLNCFSVQL